MTATLAATLAGGCSPLVERCQAGTLVVLLSLADSAAEADELTVDLSLDGGSALQTVLSHVPGQASGNVVVQFPRGYPSGSVVAVEVTARTLGAVSGVGRATATLSAACQTTTLAVAPAGDAADLSAADDLADGAAVAADLASGADLTSNPDLSCPGGGIELCFNNVDDDCDGLADCADPDCAPVAVCVPVVAAPFAYGTQEPKTGACPGNTSGAPVYLQDGTGGGCSSTCSCGGSGCTAPLTNVVPCPGGALQQPGFATVTQAGCVNIENANNFRVGSITGTLACTKNGAAAPVTPPALTTTLACTMTGTATTGGCGSGQVCVARGAKQCVSTAGAGATCPSSYPTGATWFSSYTDNRTCTCSCATAANGCTGASVGVSFFDSKSCIGTAVPEAGDICSNSLLGAKIVGGCTLSVTFANPLVFNGARTVCCQ
ncbi:MAG: cell wall surface anchor family protein [Myxococcales bacterium]|nr:cell wall surface anchor family protein [Myxococcales bacterium]